MPIPSQDKGMLSASRKDPATLRFEAVFESELSYVWTSLRRLGVHARDLEDVAHDVFLQVHKTIARYDETRPLRPWLFAFAVRAASDYRRLARHRTDLLGDDEPLVLDDASIEDDLTRREREAVVAAARRGQRVPRVRREPGTA